MRWKRTLLKAFAAAVPLSAGGCVPFIAADRGPVVPRPVALRMAVNQTQQTGIETALTGAVRDELLRDGRLPLVSESKADDVIVFIITRYGLAPLQLSAGMAPITYKLEIVGDLELLDRASGKPIRTKKDMPGVLVYESSTLPGGLTEPQAQAEIWDVLSRDIVKQAVNWFRAEKKA